MPYSGDPSSSPQDEVRFLMGDTDPNNPRLNDAEIDYLLSKYGPKPECAAYWGAARVKAKYASKARKSIGSASIEYGAIADQMAPVMEDMQRACGTVTVFSMGPPEAGGLDSPRRMPDNMDNPSAVDPL